MNKTIDYTLDNGVTFKNDQVDFVIDCGVKEKAALAIMRLPEVLGQIDRPDAYFLYDNLLQKDFVAAKSLWNSTSFADIFPGESPAFEMFFKDACKLIAELRTSESIASMRSEVRALSLPGGRYTRAMVGQRKESSSYRAIYKAGMESTIHPYALEELKQLASKTNNEIPLLELMKNENPILKIIGLMKTEGSTLVHDTADHVYFTYLLQNCGLISAYSIYLHRIGDPHLTNVFSRPGEALANIGYEMRVVLSDRRDLRSESLVITPEVLLEKLLEANETSDNQKRAIKKLKSILQGNEEGSKKKYTIYSNVFTRIYIEVQKLTWQFGYFCFLNEKFHPETIQDLLEPEYIAFVIDSIDMTLDNEEMYRRLVLQTQVLIEEYIRFQSKQHTVGTPVDETLIPEILKPYVYFSDEAGVYILCLKIERMFEQVTFLNQTTLPEATVEFFRKNLNKSRIKSVA